MPQKEFIFAFSRYFFLVLIGLFGGIIYLIFAPLTVFPVYWILSLFFGATLQDSTILFNNTTISIIPACISGSAYYFLLILNFATPMPPSKRIKNLAFLFISFLVLNVIRIVILSVMLSSNFSGFDLVHKLLWFFGSICLVIILWFTGAYIFKIREIPFFTDGKMFVSKMHDRNI